MLEERKRDPALAGLSSIGAGGESGIKPRICLARLIPNSSPPTFEAGIKPKVSQRHASLSKPSRAISNLSRSSSSRKAANDRIQFCTASSLRPCASLHAALKAHPSTLSSTYVCVHTAFAASGLSPATRRRDSPQQLSSCAKERIVAIVFPPLLCTASVTTENVVQRTECHCPFMIQWHLGAGHGKRQEGSTPHRFIVSWFQGCQDRTELSYLSFQFASVSTSNPSLLLCLLDLALCDRPRHAPNFDQPGALKLDHSTDPRNIPVDATGIPGPSRGAAADPPSGWSPRSLSSAQPRSSPSPRETEKGVVSWIADCYDDYVRYI